ncbi:MAG: hypothetical protein IJ568_04385 [Bacilli bacterium]|nr:hypothetical protein [Bacilli bacterium]
MRKISFLKNNLIAHRGLFKNGDIENSLKAFKNSIDNKCIIELDVHKTKDNKIVVFHDDNLKRLTGCDKNIIDCTLKEIKKLKLSDGQSIPTLNEVLTLVDGNVPLIIEIKTDSLCLILPFLYDLLDNYNGPFVVKSFSIDIIKRIKEDREKYLRGLLIGKTFKNIIKNIILIRRINKLDLDFISINKTIAFSNFIKVFKKLPILLWTIKDKNEYLKYKDNSYNLICENIESFRRCI